MRFPLNELKDQFIKEMDMVTANQVTVRNEFIEQAYDLMSDLTEDKELTTAQVNGYEKLINDLTNEVVTAYLEEFEKRFEKS